MPDLSLRVLSAVDPGINFYLYSLTDQPGVVASNNFLSVFNPVSSGKIMVFLQTIIQPWAIGVTSVAVSLNVYRTTAASGGTQIAAASVPRLDTRFPNPVAEVRNSNPTVTTAGLSLLGVAPQLTSSKAGALGALQIIEPSNVPGVMCLPGNGLVMQTSSGEVNQMWNLSLLWAEVGIDTVKG